LNFAENAGNKWMMELTVNSNLGPETRIVIGLREKFDGNRTTRLVQG
jgi:hypothetical protein